MSSNDAAPDLSQRMMPVVNDANRPYWTSGRDGQLVIQRCSGCGDWVHPPEPGPHHCGGTPVPTAVSGRATVWTFSVNRHAWNPAVPPPYVVALVEPVEAPGVRVITNVVNCALDDVCVGMPVSVLFEDHGDVFIPLFEPVEVVEQ